MDYDAVVYKIINGRIIAKTYDKGTAKRMVEKEGWSYSEPEKPVKIEIIEEQAKIEPTKEIPSPKENVIKKSRSRKIKEVKQ